MQAFYSPVEPLFVGPMTSSPFPLHVHESAELTCVLSGRCTMRIDGKTYHLKEGDLTLAFPLVTHSFDELSDDCRGFAAFFLPDTIAEFTSTFHTLLPDEPVISLSQLSDEVRSVIDTLMATPIEVPSPLRLAYLHLLLAHVLSAMRFHPTGTYHERGLAARAIQYIYEHACERITLDSAAYGLGISPSHLSHLFSQQFHINFRHFINAIRINRAIMQMRDPTVTLTQVCYSCGYENMRTFRRAFIQEIGILPSDYMRQLHEVALAGS